MKSIAFDGRFIRPEHPDGISRFSSSLIAELSKLTELTVMVCDQRVADRLPAGVKTIWANHPTSWRELFLARKLNRYGFQVLFSPMQTTSSFGRKFKLVLTLHDLIYYRHRTPPSQFSPGIRALWWLFHVSFAPQRWLLNQADEVVTVSETTKRAMKQHRLTSRPISVIYNAADKPVEISSENRFASKNLIYMGSFIGYKNVETLIQGMGILKDFTLVCLSRISKERELELQKLALQSGASVRFENGVTEAEYDYWLANSLALVSASLDEGFGIPVIEAMERNTPVVVSDLEIFREIGGEAALYFSASDSEEFAARVLQLTEPKFWGARSLACKSQAEQFSWQASADKLYKLLQTL